MGRERRIDGWTDQGVEGMEGGEECGGARDGLTRTISFKRTKCLRLCMGLVVLPSRVGGGNPRMFKSAKGTLSRHMRRFWMKMPLFAWSSLPMGSKTSKKYNADTTTACQKVTNTITAVRRRVRKKRERKMGWDVWVRVWDGGR